MERYLCRMILIGFSVDYLLILGTNRLLGYLPGIVRAIPAAFFGTIYRRICLVYTLRFLAAPIWRLVSLAFMSVIAFGMGQGSIKRGATLTILRFALDGVTLMGQEASIIGRIFSGAAVWILCRIGFHKDAATRKLLPLQIRYGEKNVTLMALYDTGNSLRDPISGEKVIVIDARAAKELIGLNAEQLSSPLETLATGRYPAMKLIPYHTIGREKGLLLAMRFSDVCIGGERRSAIVAFSSDEIGRGEGYRALCA